MIFFSYISDFCIENRDESIHFPLNCQLKFPNENIIPKINKTNEIMRPIIKYKWKDEHKTVFLERIRTLITQSFDQISHYTNIDINKAVETITHIYATAAESMLLKNIPY